VARELDAIIVARGRPQACVSDNGSELTGMAILAWSQERAVEWHYIAPGKPQQNAFAESFIRRLRDDLLKRDAVLLAWPSPPHTGGLAAGPQPGLAAFGAWRSRTGSLRRHHTTC
jgi:transposase InsO family protein